MSGHKKTHFLVPSWDIPATAVSLGSLIADPTEPHRPLNSTAPLKPLPSSDLNRALGTTSDPSPFLTSPPQSKVPRIDTQVHQTNFAPYTTSLSTTKKNSFSLTAQLSLIFGVGGESSVTFQTDNITSYRFQSLESEWFTPSATFISAVLAAPGVTENLAMLSPKKPLYMITGVRRVTGVTATSSVGKERSVAGGVNADATAVGVPLNAGIGAERGRGAGESVEWECEGPIVFSYQLFKLRRKKGRWAKEEYTAGALMSLDDKEEEVVDVDGGDIVEGLDDEEVDVRDDGWDDLDGEECRVVFPAPYNDDTWEEYL